MAMGLHDNDVAFFLAADEPATYIQVSMTHHSQSHDTFSSTRSLSQHLLPDLLGSQSCSTACMRFQVAEILGRDHVIWTDNGIAPSSRTSARGGEPSNKLLPLGNLGNLEVG